jgi:hypothetical protein
MLLSFKLYFVKVDHQFGDPPQGQATGLCRLQGESSDITITITITIIIIIITITIATNTPVLPRLSQEALADPRVQNRHVRDLKVVPQFVLSHCCYTDVTLLLHYHHQRHHCHIELC